MKIKFETVDDYMASLPEIAGKKLSQLRTIVKEAAPEAEEVISYNMPALRFHGMLLYFAAHKAHIGFYPGNAQLINLFREELKGYETSKGTIKFPLDRELPVKLLKAIVKQRMAENSARALTKLKKR